MQEYANERLVPSRRRLLHPFNLHPFPLSDYHIFLVTGNLSYPFARILDRLKRRDAGTNVVVNKSISGIGSLHMIRTMIAKESSWIGSYFLHVVSVDATTLLLKHNKDRTRQFR